MDRITLSVPAEHAFHGTLRLVVGGIGARTHLSYEQVNELQLAVESLVVHRQVRGDAIVVEADVEGRRVSLLLGPFEPNDDRSGLRVVERLVDTVRPVDRNGDEWLELTSVTDEVDGPET